MSRLDFLSLLVREAADAENSSSVRLERVSKAHADLLNELRAEDHRVAKVFDAARAVLSASDFTDLLHAEECLREALAACEPEQPE